MRSFIESYPNSSTRASFAPPFADYVEDVALAADQVAQIAIPHGAKYVVFSFNGEFRVKIGVEATTLALPNATTTDGSGSELNAAARRIPDALGDGSTIPTRICLRAPAACKGSLAFYR